ncbi:Elongation of fatty acids protein [Mycena venus]|uniref:Elongation of fatty acids protein n=1 Tax=Mycena venus TaxID=2733690 RepID=A0A8H6TZJ1_9AGAR|nr:Elongation of fatty acids protein [Mycena venus]
MRYSVRSLFAGERLKSFRQAFQVLNWPFLSLTMLLADFLLAHAPFTLPRHLYSFVEGQSPLSTTPVVFGSLASYLVLVFGIQAVMKNHPPRCLATLFQAHNVILSGGSFLLLVLLIEETIPIIWKTGFFNAMCSEASWTPRMEFYYMINYYFKYLELLDTVFLALKKKPLRATCNTYLRLHIDCLPGFLHVFHHSATALLCCSALIGKISGSWIPISLNLAVHVLMYYYYYATAAGARIWWKKYLTMLQIIQFVIDLFAGYFGIYVNSTATYFNGVLPRMGNCAGSGPAAVFGCGLLTVYLGLFVNFYLQTYKKKDSPMTRRTNGIANDHANGKIIAGQKSE